MSTTCTGNFKVIKWRKTMDNQQLQFLKGWLLEWLEQYNCNRGAANDGCIPGIDSLIRRYAYSPVIFNPGQHG